MVKVVESSSSSSVVRVVTVVVVAAYDFAGSGGRRVVTGTGTVRMDS